MSDKKFIDPMTTSIREERSLIELANKLLSWKKEGAHSTFYRLGIIHYITSLASGCLIPHDLIEECKLVLSNNPDYLEGLLNQRKSASQCNTILTWSDIPDSDACPPLSDNPWDRVPEDKKLQVYLQCKIPESERKSYIDILLTASEDDEFECLESVVKAVINIIQSERDFPFSSIDIGEIRRIFRVWANSARGV